MSLELFFLFTVLGLAGIAALVLILRFHAPDVILLLAALFPIAWMSRLDYVPVFVLGPHIPMHWFALAGLTVALLPFGDPHSSRALRRAIGPVLGPFAFLLLTMLMSVIANASGPEGVLMGLRAMVFTILPFPAAWVVVRTLRFEPEQFARAALVFSAVGLAVGVLAILSAIAPHLFAGVLQTTWKVEQEGGRAFTTLGGANTTGAVLAVVGCVASGMLLAGRQRAAAALGLAVSFGGILASVARAVLLAFIAAHLYLYGRPTKGLGRRLALLIALLAIIVVPVFNKLQANLKLERLRTIADNSASVRVIAMDAAVRFGLANPVFGGGWGIVYPYARTVAGVQDLPRIWYVGEISTPLVKPHSLFAIMLAECGLPGLLALCFFFWRWWQALRPPPARLDLQGNSVVAGYRAAFICIVIIAVFQDDLFIISKLAFLLYLPLFCGALASQYYRAAATAAAPAPVDIATLPVELRVAAALRIGAGRT